MKRRYNEYTVLHLKHHKDKCGRVPSGSFQYDPFTGSHHSAPLTACVIFPLIAVGTVNNGIIKYFVMLYCVQIVV